MAWYLTAGVLTCLMTGAGLWIGSRWPTYRTCGNTLVILGTAVAAYLISACLHPIRPAAAAGIFWTVTALLGLAALAGGFSLFLVLRTAWSKPPEGLSWLIVLGCVVLGDRPTRSLQDRILGAYAYLQSNPHTRCVVSGGLGPRASITEAVCMQRELVAMGIAPERIFLEEQARNTWQNLDYSQQLICRQGGPGQGIGLVSSEYHMYRACVYARRQGLSVKPVSARTSRGILRLNYTLREMVAVWRMLLRL